ncbi:MAG: HigA family addiction module antidote protein [Oligoflexales bacterium]|nr:HigA family addiction module antidote protein [Oligoflexales bacterium]
MSTITKKRPKRRPEHPGAILKRVWLDELGYTQSHFVELLVEKSPTDIKHSTMQTKLNELVRGKRSMTADFAVLISQVLDTNPKLWMNLQSNLDIWEAEQRMNVVA